MDPATVGQSLAIQFAYSDWTFRTNLEGLSTAESLQPPATGGNCLNWVVGHVLAARNHILALLGEPPALAPAVAQRFERGSEPLRDPAAALDLDEARAVFRDAQERILAGLQRLTPEQLAAAAPFSPGNRPDETVGSLLLGMVWHEAYHVGQLGVLRRVAGHPGGIA